MERTKIISLGYTNSAGFNDPDAWLKRINFYTGILEALTRRHRVESVEQIRYNGQIERNGVMYHFLNYERPEQLFPVRLHTHVNRLKPDVVLVNGLIFPLQVIQLKLRLGKRARIVCLHRAERPYKGIKRYLQKLADRYVDAYLFSSLDFRKQWIRNIKISKMHQVVQASSVFSLMDRQVAKDTTKAEGAPAFLWVGRLDANKDPLTVVFAFLEFLYENPGARLYMIYQSEYLLTELCQLINMHPNGRGRIHLVGKVDHEKLQEWYNSVEFVISGSHYEGSGISVLEAMSCGCIPIITNIESFRAMTGRGKCGILYQAGNARDLFTALCSIQQMNIVLERQKVLDQFNSELSFEAIAGRIESVIASIKK